MIVACYEDRAKALPCVKLLALSLAEHCPGQPLDLTCPGLVDRINAWPHKPEQMRLRPERNWPGRAWDVKAGKLLELLDEGWPEVVWVDTDVLVTSDLMAPFRGLDPQTLVVGQEFNHSFDPGLTEGWGLEPGRDREFGFNGGFIRVTTHHRRLLERWG